MKARLSILVLLLGFSVSLHASGPDSLRVKSVKTYGLEIGTGISPLTSLLTSPSRSDLAEKGQDYNKSHHFCLDVSGTLRFSPYWEVALTAGYAWCMHDVIQFDSFGYTPDGKPRYDLTKSTQKGWVHSDPVISLTGQFRLFWSPDWETVQGYSGAGIGLVYDIDTLYPCPSLTLIGLRFGEDHFYGFVENTYGPMATFLYFGLGWIF